MSSNGLTPLGNSRISKSAATSDIVDQNACSIDEHRVIDEKIIQLQQELETKNAMFQTAASAGQQLCNENDDLHQKLRATTKIVKEKEDELETYKRTNDMLKITATRSGDEADELHKKLIESQQITEQLKEENALLISMNDTSKTPQTPINHSSFDEHTANDIICKLEHEKCTLQQFLQSEQEKCSKFLQNAEINARQLSHQQNENQDLKQDIAKLKNENNELTHNTRREIQKYSETLHQIESENESLRLELHEQQKIVNDMRKDSALKSPRRVCSMSDNIKDDGLFGDLEDLGYVATDNLDDDDQSNELSSPTHQFRKATADAQEEFFRLTVIAAKIKFNDVPIATSVLWDKVKEANLSFHEVADWLNKYLLVERKKIKELQSDSEASRLRMTSITNDSGNSPPKHFFRKIKDLADSVTNFSSTLRLEVRFGRRVFEVKMKKHDKLETLLQTLPRIIGEDADSMEIFSGKDQLDPKDTLLDLSLNNNAVLRMIHRKRVASYLRRYERKMNDGISGELDSENTQETLPETNL